MYSKIISCFINFFLGVLLSLLILAVVVIFEENLSFEIAHVVVVLFWGIASAGSVIYYNRDRYDMVKEGHVYYDLRTFWKTLIIPLCLPLFLTIGIVLISYLQDILIERY